MHCFPSGTNQEFQFARDLQPSGRDGPYTYVQLTSSTKQYVNRVGSNPQGRPVEKQGKKSMCELRISIIDDLKWKEMKCGFIWGIPLFCL